MKNMNDAQLVLLTLAGDPAAFDFLVDRYWPTAVALCLGRIDQVSEAEDLAQEGFIQAYQNLHTLKDTSRFAGWLTRIMQRKCTDYYRAASKSRHVSLETVTALQVETCAAYSSNPGLTPAQIHLIREKVAKLPESYQHLIVLRFMAGLSTQEIARQLNKHYGAIRTGFHRAYQMLRQELSPLFMEVNDNEL